MSARDTSALLLWKSGQTLVQRYQQAIGLWKALLAFQGSAVCSWTAKGEIPPIYTSHSISTCEREVTLWKMRNHVHLWEVRKVWTISKVTFSWKTIVNNALSITHFMAVQTWIYCFLPIWRRWQSLLRYSGGRKEGSSDAGSAIQCKWWQKSSRAKFRPKLFSHCNWKQSTAHSDGL